MPFPTSAHHGGRALLVLALTAALLAILAIPAGAADRPFTQRFAATDTGDTLVVGNTVMTCAGGGLYSCSQTRNGTLTGTGAQNGSHVMQRVDADTDSSTSTSSSADVTIPSGATVLFAGLYWGGDSSANTNTRNDVDLKVPGATSYTEVDATTFDTSTLNSQIYQGFANVTTAVRGAGSGTYWVGNVSVDTGTGAYGGWSLVLVYRDPSAPRHNLFVYDGLVGLESGGTSNTATLTVSGLTTPTSGTVDLDLGVVAYDGDRALTGDFLQLQSTTLTDALNPSTNFFNSTIGRRGTRITAKNPDYVDQLGFDADVISADGVLAPNASTATFTANTGSSELFALGMLSFVTESDADPPETTVTSGPSGATNATTPVFAFTSSETGSTFECRIDNASWFACSTPYTPASFAEGAHTFDVRGIDRAGNVDPTPATRTFTVDVTAPNTTIDSGPSGPTNDSTPTFAFSSNETGATFECRVDAGAWAACTSAFTTAALADGAHTFDVRATDPAGNVDTTPASRSFTVDTATPDTTIDSGPNGPTNDNTPTFGFSANQTGSTFQCRVDTGAWATCTSAFTTAALTDGAHTFEVRSTDTASNVDPTPASRGFTVDTAAPQTTIDSGPSGPTNDSTPTFAFSSNETGSTFECRVDTGAWATCTSAFTTAALTDGTHTFEVRATDAAGNVDVTPAARSFTVDTGAPQTTIDSGPSGPTSDSTPTFGFSADQTGSTFQCRVDTGAWATCTSGHTTAALADGAHTFEVRATDAAGNTDATPATRSFTVDTAAPQTTIDAGPNGTINVATPSFGFSADQSGSTFECRVDGGSWAPCSSPRTTASLADGSHTFEVRATDPAGNTDATPATRTFTVDTTAPETTIGSGPSGPTNDATPTFAFTSETGATFECRVDGGAWASCTSPETTAGLADGPHTFEVHAVDAAGNIDLSPATRTFTVDTAEPQTAIDSGPADTTNDSTPAFAFSADQSGSTFECRVDGGAWTACTTPETLAALADGQHTFDVRATDPAGNTDPTPATRTFIVDTSAPDTTITAGPTGPTGSTPTFAFTADEAGATFECSVDGGPWTACTSPYTSASLADGDHVLRVRALDAAGNVDATPASWSFSVDTAAAQTSITAGPIGPTGDATPTFAFEADDPAATFQCRLDGGAWTACTSPETLAALADGPHTLEARSVDPAGNADPTPATRAFTVDTAAPDTTITAGPSGLTTDATPEFGLAADEAGSTFECRTDGGAWTACTASETLATLADGQHTFEARAVDAAGNADPTPASRSFTVDTDAPQTTIDSGPSAPTTDATPEFPFSADESGSTFECRIDGGAWTPCTSPLTTATLADGDHELEVRATDTAGNVDPTPASRSFTVDTSAPDTTIAAGPSGATNDATPEFALSADQAGSTFECRLDGGSWTTCTTPETLAALADGQHTFEVRATDLAGNTDPTPAASTFTVDTRAPETTITAGPSGLTTDATPEFGLGADEAGATFECRVDGGAWTTCTTPETLAALADGAHTFDVRATDAAGNVDPTPATRSFTVDSGAPQTTIDSGPAGATNDATPEFAFSADESGSTFECRIDGSAWTPCTTPETVATLADGQHTVDVRATDAAGNVDPTPATRAFTVDTAAPQTTIDSGPAGATNDATPEFAFSADESGSTFECRIDGGAWTPCTTPETLATLADGEHTFDVRATDPAGNVDPTPATRTFTVDSGAPQTTIDSGPSGPTNDATPEFGLGADEAGATFECRVDGGAWAPCTSPFTAPALADGDHTVEVRATDAAGNTDPTPASRSVTVDTSVPQTSITAGPTGVTTDDTPELMFSSDETGVTFECRVDGGAWAPCGLPHTTAALTDGQHTFEVRATDQAGNVDPTPASRTFTVDATAPQTTIDAGPSGPTGDATPELAFSADEAVSTFECRVDGGAWTACTSRETLATLGDGEHTFEVRATDAAGNVDPTPATRTFTVDTAAPDTTIDSGPADPTSDATPDLAFSSDQAGATFECRVDGGAWAPCATPQTLGPLADGPHTLEVRATDPAGNVDATPASRSFTMDTAAPDTTVTAGPSGTISDATPELTLAADEPGSTFECRIDGGAWTPCGSPFTTPALVDGPHTVEVRATDAAGNVDATPASRSFTLDTGAPQTTITGGPGGRTGDSTPTFAFAADELAATFECRIDGGSWVACSSSHTTQALTDGDHTLEVRATDTTGNVDPTPASRTFTVDTAAPQSSITSGPSGTTSDDTPTFDLTSDDAGASFECRIDGGAWVRCSSPFTAGSLTDGEHTLEVRAVDAAGNADATPASRTFRVARPTPVTTPAPTPVAPVVTVTAPADNAPVPTFTFNADQAATSYQCRVDGAAFAPCGASFTVPGTLAEGEHSLDVLGVGANGLRSAPVRVTFQVGAGCAGTTGFRSASLRGSGRGLQIRFVRNVAQPVRADIFQVSIGRKVLRERLIARYRNLQRSQAWPGAKDSRGRRIVDGYYFVRLSIPLGNGGTDVRRLVAQRSNGRWVARPGYYGRPICGLVSSYKLERPVFGGASSSTARISFRLAVPGRVTVEVRRGGRVVKRLGGKAYAARRTIRLSLPARGLRPGVYEFRLTAVSGSRRAVVTASGRRL